MAGARCAACDRPLEEGDWITRESTVAAMTHAVCPPKRPFYGRKRDRAHPLIDTIALAISAAFWFTACASPAAPTLPAVTIGVHVLEYTDQATPIAGATVIVNRVPVTTTDAAGMASVAVHRGQDVTIRVEHAGYQPFSAEGFITSPETWTFYLMPAE